MLSLNDIFAIFLVGLWIIAPAYFANAMAVLTGRKKRYNMPIDGGRYFIDGRRILGNGKTIFGFIGGVLLGNVFGGFEFLFREAVADFAVEAAIEGNIQATILESVPVLIACTSPNAFLLRSFLLSLGALIGDLIGSFIKRRLNLRRGAPAPILDQLDFLIMAVLGAYIVTPLPVSFIIVLLIFTPLAHILANFIAWALKIKKEPW